MTSQPITPIQPGASGMLVLSRQVDEEIVIGDDIVVSVVRIRGDKVRLGISAPDSISIHRREVYEAIQRERAGELVVAQTEGGAQ